MEQATQKPHVLIIGAAGRIGRAMAHIFSQANVTDFDLCDSDTANCPVQRPLAESAPEADIIIMCVYSWVTREILEQIAPLVKKSAVIVSMAKGIEKDSNKTMDVVLDETIGDRASWCVMSGPMLAEEILANGGSAGVIASNSTRAFEILSAWMLPQDVILSASSDVRGVALSGVLKNVYVLTLGIADGLEWSANRRGWLLSRAAHEMHLVMEKLGGEQETTEGPAVLGDLVACAFSPLSRNRATGDTLVKTGELNPKSEGANSLNSLLILLGDAAKQFPLLQAIKAVALDHKSAHEIFDQMISRHEV